MTEKLTNVTWDLGKRNWAGTLPVDRPGHPNDTLFFWGWEKDEGSFTDANSDKPWGIWINGPMYGCHLFLLMVGADLLLIVLLYRPWWTSRLW